MKLYMFRTFPLSIIRSSFTVHSAMVYVIQTCRQLSNRTRMELSSNLVLFESWTEGLSETLRVLCRNKFVNLVHLVGFIIKKFVTMHGHMNVKLVHVTSVSHIIKHILLVEIFLRYTRKFKNIVESLFLETYMQVMKT